VPRRYVLDASAGVEILNRTPLGLALAKRTRKLGAEEWTVEHFHVEVAKFCDVTSSEAILLTPTQARRSALVRWPLNVARVAPRHRAWT
jgi:hypothetical protein